MGPFPLLFSHWLLLSSFKHLEFGHIEALFVGVGYQEKRDMYISFLDSVLLSLWVSGGLTQLLIEECACAQLRPSLSL